MLVIGGGRVGSRATELLADEGARITVIDPDETKTDVLKRRFPSISMASDLPSAVASADALLNASPARIKGEWIREGAIISSPGMPYSFDALGESRAAVLVHDPLQIGVSVMAAWSASFSMHGKAKKIGWPQAIEVVQ